MEAAAEPRLEGPASGGLASLDLFCRG